MRMDHGNITCFNEYRLDCLCCWKTTSEDEVATYSISGVIFDDTNKNGEQDKNEPGVSGIEVRAISKDKKTYKAVTEEDGTYHIKVDEAGKYEINMCAKFSDIAAYNLDNTVKITRINLK